MLYFESFYFMACVYKHIRKNTNEIFYIGIGKNNSRAFSKESRSKFWKDLTKNNDYIVEILYDDITWEDACIVEKRLIKEIGRRDLKLGTLVNVTDGGDGTENPSECAREKIKQSNKNRQFSEKHRKYLKNKFSGDENPMKNELIKKKMSEYFKGKYIGIQNGKSKSIIQYDLDGNLINEYESMTQAGLKTNSNISHISKVCNGKLKTTNGFIWKFKI